MIEELQAEIERLKAENVKLATDLAGAHDDLKEVRAEARDRRHENKNLAQQVEYYRAAGDQLRGRILARPEGARPQLPDQLLHPVVVVLAQGALLGLSYVIS